MIMNSIQTYTNILLSESLNSGKEWFNDLPIVVCFSYYSLIPKIFSKIKVNLVQIVLVNTDLLRLVKWKPFLIVLLQKCGLGCTPHGRDV